MENVTRRPQMNSQVIVTNGTSQLDIFSIVLSMLASGFTHHWFTTRFSYFHFFGGELMLFLVEFITLCLPPLLIHTIFGNYVVLMTVFQLTICFFLSKSTRKLRVIRTSIAHEFKVIILVSTCVVIAAVDCKLIFTPRFVKTQMFGFSPMDLGTGLFVAVKGLDTLRRDLRDANVFQSNAPTSKAYQTYKSEKKSHFTVPRFLPLLVIGVARSLFVLSTHYFQDPTEYGMHWNFFITLAIIELFISAVRFVSKNPLAAPIMSVLIGLSYFGLLIFGGYEEYILDTNSIRSGFIDSNREGIFSTLGYLFIFGFTYLVGRFFVPLIVWDEFYTKQVDESRVLINLIRNFVIQVIFYAFALNHFGLPSRRSANLVYGLHIHVIVTIILVIGQIYLRQIGTRTITASLTTQLPTLHSAIIRQGGYFFLAANLLTGCLNFCRTSINTPVMEFISQIFYMFILCLGTKLLDSFLTTKGDRRLLRKL